MTATYTNIELEFIIVYLNLHGNFYIDLRKFYNHKKRKKKYKNILTKKSDWFI
jgi:hypothetical protein